MDEASIKKKLAMLDKKTSELLVDARNAVVADYIKSVNGAIKKAQEVVATIDTGEDGFSPEFSSIAYGILNQSPFTTKTHLCIAFRVNEITIDKWVTEYPEFKQCVEQGILEGELLARDLLVQSAFEPSQKINTNLLKILSTNVYNIKDAHDVTLKAPEPLKFQIEVVSATKHTDT